MRTAGIRAGTEGPAAPLRSGACNPELHLVSTWSPQRGREWAPGPSRDRIVRGFRVPGPGALSCGADWYRALAAEKSGRGKAASAPDCRGSQLRGEEAARGRGGWLEGVG